MISGQHSRQDENDPQISQMDAEVAAKKASASEN
jgi:hypothetical protein